VHLAEDAGMELPADLYREVVADAGVAVAPPAHQGDRLGDDVVRREKEVGEPLATVRFQDLGDAGVVPVVGADVREEEARVEEDHSLS